MIRPDDPSRRGVVEITEVCSPHAQTRLYELQWREAEPEPPGDEEILAEATVDDAQAALEWARARADVVIVIRAADSGYMTAYSAGTSAPADSPEMPPLDEAALVAGRPPPAPLIDETRDDAEGDVEWPGSPRPVRPEPFFSSPRQATGPAAQRLSNALDRLGDGPDAISMRALRRLLQEHALFAGDNEFPGSQPAGAPELFAVFDHADSSEVVRYLLAEIDRAGVVTDLHVVDFERHVRLPREARTAGRRRASRCATEGPGGV